MKASSDRQASTSILAIHGGSSSIKFALFTADPKRRWILAGAMESIGLAEVPLMLKGSAKADKFTRSVTAPKHTIGVGLLMDWIEERFQWGELPWSIKLISTETAKICQKFGIGI